MLCLACRVLSFLMFGCAPFSDYVSPFGSVQSRESCLHLAAHGGHLIIAELLLDHGADINAQNKVCGPVTLWSRAACCVGVLIAGTLHMASVRRNAPVLRGSALPLKGCSAPVATRGHRQFDESFRGCRR